MDTNKVKDLDFGSQGKPFIASVDCILADRDGSGIEMPKTSVKEESDKELESPLFVPVKEELNVESLSDGEILESNDTPEEWCGKINRLAAVEIASKTIFALQCSDEHGVVTSSESALKRGKETTKEKSLQALKKCESAFQKIGKELPGGASCSNIEEPEKSVNESDLEEQVEANIKKKYAKTRRNQMRTQVRKEKEKQIYSSEKISLKQDKSQQKGERTFCCESCGKCFRCESHLKVHIRVHTGERPFECSLCEKSFVNKSNLIVHMQRHTDERSFRCTICKMTFKSSSDLNGHMWVHSKEKRFKCKDCGRGFRDSRDVTKHMRTHTGERPFTCIECEKAFTESSSLARHMRTHSGEKPFSCMDCGSHFSRYSSLTRHRRRTHEITSLTS